MKRVYTASDPLIVGHLEEVLSSAGIACVVRNRYLAGGVGELPPNEVWPQLLVQRDADEERAHRLIAETLEGDASGPAWRCPSCGERIEGQFAFCWNCGAAAPQ